MTERLGLFGGSFNPIHCGHLIVARAIAERLELERVVFLPSARPPHKNGETLADPAHRAEMVKLAIAGEPLFDFSDFDLTREGPSYTIDTVGHFQAGATGGLSASVLRPSSSGGTGRQAASGTRALHWIVGADSLAELTTWHRVGALVDACRIITAVRPGWDQVDLNQLRTALSEAQIVSLQTGVLETPAIDISSTDIRNRVRQGKSIRYLVPDRVGTYIQQHGLYRKGKDDLCPPSPNTAEREH